MRRMSFSATTQQMRNRTKTVTRRRPETWKNLQPGDRLLAVEKAMGLPKGAKQVPLGVIEIVDVRVEPLHAIRSERHGAKREGFPDSDGGWFVLFWQIEFGGDEGQLVRRIEFRHVAPEDQG